MSQQPLVVVSETDVAGTSLHRSAGELHVVYTLVEQITYSSKLDRQIKQGYLYQW